MFLLTSMLGEVDKKKGESAVRVRKKEKKKEREGFS